MSIKIWQYIELRCGEWEEVPEEVVTYLRSAATKITAGEDLHDALNLGGASGTASERSMATTKRERACMLTDARLFGAPKTIGWETAYEKVAEKWGRDDVRSVKNTVLKARKEAAENS